MYGTRHLAAAANKTDKWRVSRAISLTYLIDNQLPIRLDFNIHAVHTIEHFPTHAQWKSEEKKERKEKQPLTNIVLAHSVANGQQRHRDTETQRHRDTETQRHRDTGHDAIPSGITPRNAKNVNG